MKISYENGSQAGYGFFRCTEENFSEGAYTLFLQRRAEKSSLIWFLGAQGWGERQTSLPLMGQRREDGALILDVGPAVVDELVNETCRVRVQGEAGESFTATLNFVGEIRRSPAKERGNMETRPDQTPEAPVAAAVTPPLDPAPAPASPSETVPADAASGPPPADPATVVPADQGEATTANELLGNAPDMAGDLEDAEQEAVTEDQESALAPASTAAAAPGAPDEEASVFAKPDETPKRGGGGLLVFVIVLLLLLALGGAAWYFLKNKAPEPTPVPPQIDNPTPAQPEPPKPEPPQPEPAQEPPPQPAPSANERVKAFFGGPDRSPAGATRLARELPKENPADQDAVYRLWSYAVDKGEPGAMMDYAACLDPSKPRWGSIGKDAAAAWDIYEKAKAGDPAAASEAQQNLRAWLEREAASGNEEARDWLRRLP